jgi:hypothetical protein
MFEHAIPEFMPELIGSQTKATIRRQPQQVTALFAKERGDDPLAEAADRWFLCSLIGLYGRRSFQRGNLDAGRLNRLFGREIVPATSDAFEASSLASELRINMDEAVKYLQQLRD